MTQGGCSADVQESVPRSPRSSGDGQSGCPCCISWLTRDHAETMIKALPSHPEFIDIGCRGRVQHDEPTPAHERIR